MTPEQFKQVEDLFHQLQQLPPSQRAQFLDQHCPNDSLVRAEVESLLEHPTADSPISRLGEDLKSLVNSVASGSSAPSPRSDSASWVGHSVGSYQIIGVVGQGGMGVIYLGRDVQLNRLAALKSLPPEASRDPIRLERLRREARALAAVSHPNVATLYGMEEAHNTLFIAMEHIDGKTLSQRLGRSPLPISDALSICAQIAAGVEAAHEAGVIHRDLKPGNVMFTADGTVKVLDFGLARELPEGQSLVPNRETRLFTLTREGSFFGTPAYMSPEQARGEPLDRRSDIFSFGSILFRCLTGRPAFDGESDAELLDAILHGEPDWDSLPGLVPPSVRAILRRCLAKKPADRYRHIGDARLDLIDALAERAWERRAADSPRWWRTAVPYAVALLAVAVLVAMQFRNPPEPVVNTASLRPQRFDLTLPEDATQGDLERIQVAISPDGRTIVVAVSTPSVGRALWMRPYNSGEWRRIEHTEDAHRPFFSTDGEWIGFHRGSHAYKRRLTGAGDPIRIGTSSNWYGGAFTDDGGVILASHWSSALTYVPPRGKSQFVTEVDESQSEVSHISPAVISSTRWVLFNVWRGGEESDIVATHLDSGERHVVIANASTPRVTPTPRGHYLLFERASTIFAAPIDPQTARLTGPEVALVDGVMSDGTRFAAYFDVGADGTLVYFPGQAFAEESRLAYVNPDGTSTPINDDRMSYCEPSFSADGQRLAISIKGKTYRAMVYDLKRGTKEFIPTPGEAAGVGISPDGQFAVITGIRNGTYGVDLYSLTTGLHIRRIVEHGPDYASDLTWSPTGKFLTFSQAKAVEAPRDIWLLEMTEGATPQPLVATPTTDMHGSISPDGKWLACVTELTGRREVYIAAIPSGQPMRQVTFSGAEMPAWAPDGKAIYYSAPQGLVRLPINPADGTVAGQPQVVYDKPFGQSDSLARSLTVAPDGRPVVVEPSERRPTVSHLHVITNWYRLLP